MEYRTFLERPGTYKVVLYPTSDEARRRNLAGSSGQGGSYIDGAISIAYEILAPVVGWIPEEGWLVLDTTDLDVDASVAAIRENARRATP